MVNHKSNNEKNTDIKPNLSFGNSILILGAKSKIAKALASLYAKNGYNLILAGRNIENDLKDFIEQIKNKYNIQIMVKELDILTFSSHEKFYNSIKQKPIGVISFIGLIASQLDNDSTFSNKQLLLNTNFLGVMNIIDIISEDFQNKKSGWITAISSIAAERARGENFIYAASKSALNTFMEGKRIALLPYNVQISTIKLGPVNTPMIKDFKYPQFLISHPSKIAKKIYKIQQTKYSVKYLPSYWKFVMLILKNLPEKLYCRII